MITVISIGLVFVGTCALFEHDKHPEKAPKDLATDGVNSALAIAVKAFKQKGKAKPEAKAEEEAETEAETEVKDDQK